MKRIIRPVFAGWLGALLLCIMTLRLATCTSGGGDVCPLAEMTTDTGGQMCRDDKSVNDVFAMYKKMQALLGLPVKVPKPFTIYLSRFSSRVISCTEHRMDVWRKDRGYSQIGSYFRDRQRREVMPHVCAKTCEYYVFTLRRIIE